MKLGFGRLLWCASAVLILLGACAPESNAYQRFPDLPSELGFGQPFDLVVERGYPQDWQLEPWQDDWLAPFTVQAQQVRVWHRGGMVHERRRYRARLFALDQSWFRPALLRPVNGEPLAAEPYLIRVRSGLPKQDDGIAEVAPGPLALPQPWWRRHLRGILAAVIGVVAYGAAARLRPSLPELRPLKDGADAPADRLHLTSRIRALVALLDDGRSLKQRQEWGMGVRDLVVDYWQHHTGEDLRASTVQEMARRLEHHQASLCSVSHRQRLLTLLQCAERCVFDPHASPPPEDWRETLEALAR